MERRIDLHLHSTCSDGLLAPEELVQRAQQLGLAAIALCDHDNVDGVERAQAAGERLGVEVLSGVELSVQWRHFEDVHLLGYLFDPAHPPLVRALAEFREYREGRNARIVERINQRLAQQRLPPIDFARVLERAGGTIGRPHIAMELIATGAVQTTDEAFIRYLVPCNVAKRYFELGEAIDLIHAAGGVAVLAHPPFISRDRGVLTRLFDVFTELGVDGIEAYNNGASPEEARWFVAQAQQRALAVTGGSDYHGDDDRLITMGYGRGDQPIPYGCVEQLREAWQCRHGGEKE